jgi:uncharacterized protein YdaU (DUF1376 family)
MAEFPALTLWTDSYLADTRMLSTVEHGAYLLLLMESWRRPHCDLPDDDKILARLAGLARDEWDEIKPTIMGFWTYDGRSKTWHQKRLRKERDAARVRSKSAKDKAAKRWNKGKNDDAGALPGECPEDASTATAIITTEDTDVSSLSGDEKKPRKLRKGEKHSMPEGWHPAEFGPRTESAAVIAGWSPKDFAHHLESFKSHHTARASKFVDWQSAWGTWVLNSRSFGNGRSATSSGDSSDEFARAARRWANLGDAEELAPDPDGRTVQPGEGDCQGTLALPEAGH